MFERLGVGDFGTVWKAHDLELDRTVAIKIPRRGQLDPLQQEQFLREARAAAQLRHPNIVSIHEVGREGDTLFIVSDLVRGVSLSDWLTGSQPTFSEAAELCRKIALALHHAHEAGVVHRDLKPSNIMIDYEGEPHLMDFGLAKRDSGEITMTADGSVLGTPTHISPEQARGEAHSADRRPSFRPSRSRNTVVQEKPDGSVVGGDDYRPALFRDGYNFLHSDQTIYPCPSDRRTGPRAGRICCIA